MADALRSDGWVRVRDGSANTFAPILRLFPPPCPGQSRQVAAGQQGFGVVLCGVAGPREGVGRVSKRAGAVVRQQPNARGSPRLLSTSSTV